MKSYVHFDNMTHAKFLGLVWKGQQISTCKLVEKEVLEIRRLCKAGFKQKDIAKKFGINRSQVSKIKDRKYWNYI